MFSFVPPAKVARTQRVRYSSGEEYLNSSRSTQRQQQQQQQQEQSVRNVHSSRVDGVADRFSTALGASQLSATSEPSLSLSGIGESLCWVTDENSKMIRIWSLNQPFVSQAPRIAQIPVFTELEGNAVFASEIPTEESLAFCTANGSVASLDHTIEFSFYVEGLPLTATSFAVDTSTVPELTQGKPTQERNLSSRSQAESVNLVAIGTADGLVMASTKVAGERSVCVFNPREPNMLNASANVYQHPSSNANGANPRNSTSWSLWSWFSKNNRTDQNSSGQTTQCSTGSVDAAVAVTEVRFSASQPGRMWAINAASEVLLLDYRNHVETGSGEMQLCWAANVARAAAGGEECSSSRIVAFAEGKEHAYVLLVVEEKEKESAASLQGGEQGDDDSDIARNTQQQRGDFRNYGCALVTLRASTGAVDRVTQLNSSAALVDALARIAHDGNEKAHLSVDEGRRTATILAGKQAVAVATAPGVRSPCLSEDVRQMRGTSGATVCGAACRNGRVVILSANGPSYEDAGEVVTGSSTTATMAYVGRMHEHGTFSADINQRISGILSALRIDQRLTLDDAVLQASEEICLRSSVSEGNWARADLDDEDDNLVMQVTRHLVSRQQEHRQLMLAVLHNREIEPYLQQSTVAKLISDQEMFIALVGLRRLQNDSGVVFPTNSEESNGLPTLSLIRTQMGNNTGARQYVRAVQSAMQRERCQTALRAVIVRFAQSVRERRAHATRATAAELAFSDPANVVDMLHILSGNLRETLDSLAVDQTEKFDVALSIGTLFVTAIQTINESRREMEKQYGLHEKVRSLMWTSSSETRYGIDTVVAEQCSMLAETLATIVSLAQTASSGAQPAVNITENEQFHLLDILSFLLYFSFDNHSQRSSTFLDAALRSTLLRSPFVQEPIGYPYGEPQAAAGPSESANLCQYVVRICEDLALQFDVKETIVTFALANKLEDPLSSPHVYQRLENYCLKNPLVFEFAMEALLLHNREVELLQLPQLVPAFLGGEAQHEAFLEKRAPHLQWLVNPRAFSALTKEGKMNQVFVPYGDTLLSHRSRCVSMGKLAWIAAGAPVTGSAHALFLDKDIVSAQKRFLSPQDDGVHLGVSEAVQRLIDLDNREAWPAAAKLLCNAPNDVRDDLFVQVLRRAKLRDGEAVRRIAEEAVSELEVSRALEKTTLGRVLLACTELKKYKELMIACETVLEPQDTQFLSSWLKARYVGALQ